MIQEYGPGNMGPPMLTAFALDRFDREVHVTLVVTECDRECEEADFELRDVEIDGEVADYYDLKHVPEDYLKEMAVYEMFGPVTKGTA
jgi:hypothetical protein